MKYDTDTDTDTRLFFRIVGATEITKLIEKNTQR